MDFNEDLKRSKQEIEKIRNPKRRAEVNQAIELHHKIAALTFELRVLRELFTDRQVLLAKRTAILEQVAST